MQLAGVCILAFYFYALAGIFFVQIAGDVALLFLVSRIDFLLFINFGAAG